MTPSAPPLTGWSALAPCWSAGHRAAPARRAPAAAPGTPRVRTAQRAILKTLELHIAKLEAAAEAAIAANAGFAARAEIILSVPGLGRQFAAGALAWLPELGAIADKPLAALVGLAPYDADSGARIAANVTSGADGRRSATCFTWSRSAPPPGTTRSCAPTTGSCAP